MSGQASLEQKQMYLRDNIDKDEYENFYEYCQQCVGSVDINSWNMAQVEEIVRKFNAKLKQEAVENAKNLIKETYNQYQSRSKGNEDHRFDDNQQQSEISQCKSSKIVKTSAVDLLDEILQSQSSYSSVKTQQKGNSTNRSSMHNMHTNYHSKDDNNVMKNNSAFSEFEFWTSTIGSNKNQGQNRNKSMTQQSKNMVNVNAMGGSPPTPKNTYNFSEYYNVSNMPSNNNSLHANEQSKARHSTQQIQLKNTDFDIFTTGIVPDAAKKSSPYLKKQNTQQVYEGTKGTIKLKQVKQIHDPSSGVQRGMSMNKAQTMGNYQEPFQETITCYKSAIRSQLSDRSLNVYLDKHEIIERKFLAADYAMYNMKITPLGIQCKRNYEDFAKLRSNLAKFYPGVHLPYLQETSWLSGTNIDFITNQKKMLELFTRNLIRNKQIRNSRVMEDFLTIKDHKSIKRKFQKYDQMENLKGLQQLCLLEGKVKVTLNTQQKIYIQNFQKYLDKMGSLYERQQKLTQTLIDQYAQVMKTFKSLISLMQQMQKEVRQFNTKVPVNMIRYFGHAIKIVRETYKQELSNIKFDFDVNQKKILPFLKYERRNFQQLNKLIDIQKKMKRSFDKRSLTEKIGVGENYMSEATRNGAKKGILQESPSLLVLKYQAAYLGYQARNEGQRVFDQLAVKTLIRWQTLGDSYLRKQTASKDYWQSLINIDGNKFNTDLTF